MEVLLDYSLGNSAAGLFVVFVLRDNEFNHRESPRLPGRFRTHSPWKKLPGETTMGLEKLNISGKEQYREEKSTR